MPILKKLCFFTISNERSLIKLYYRGEEKKRQEAKELLKESKTNAFFKITE